MYRLRSRDTTLVGVAHKSQAENDAFVTLARHFASHNLPVPRIYSYKPSEGVYLEQDLGEVTLLDYLLSERTKTGQPFPNSVQEVYKSALRVLPRFQIEAARTLDFSLCLGAHTSFAVILSHDLKSFARELVGRLLPLYDTNALNEDFSRLISYLSEAKSAYFLYRDFQSRNIMLVNGEPFFIDFQSGLKGPLQYDVISLLYQSSAKIPEEHRQSLVETYLEVVATHASCDREVFFRHYPAFIVSRMLQVLGVYGRQGLGAQKEYFAQSIPAALRTLDRELRSSLLGVRLDGLLACSEALLKSIKV